jgi:hypothetical protein
MKQGPQALGAASYPEGSSREVAELRTLNSGEGDEHRR